MTCESLQTLEPDIINNTNSWEVEIISLKDRVIKRLQEENVRLCDKYRHLENRMALLIFPIMPLCHKVAEAT